MLRSPLLPFAAGLGLVYVAERSLADAARWSLDGLGAALLVAGLALAVARLARVWSEKTGESRKATGAVLASYVVCLVALGLYAVQAAFLEGAEHAGARDLLQVAWPFVLLLGLAPALTIELALSAMALSPTYELWRVKLAGRAARVVVYSIVVFAGVNYAAAQWNRKIDLSYFRTTEPSEPTIQLVKGLSEPVRLVLFAPPGNEVADAARGYLDALAHASGEVRLEVVDQALEPALAKELKVRQNGVLAIAKGGRSELVQLGLDMEAARNTLRKLDGEVQRRLLLLVKPPRTIYLTTGHMERDYIPASGDERLGLSDFKALATQLGFTVKRLGLAEGLGSEVPADAGVVVVAGPTEPFLPSENAAIAAYLARGGRLMVFVDPDNGVTEDELLAPLGVRVTSSLVASDRETIRLEGRGTTPFDFATARFSSHPSVTTLSRNTGKLATILLGAGAIEKTKDVPAGLRQVFTIHSPSESWEDADHNGIFDPRTEQRHAREVAVAIEGTLPTAAPKTQSKPAEKGNADGDKSAPAALAAEPATAKPGASKAEAASAKPDPKTPAKIEPTKPAAAKTAKTAKADEPAPAQPMRAIVVSDADVIGNGVLRNPGNAYLVADGLKWLAGDEQLAGETTSEEDVAIVHKRADDAVWFYGTSFAVPAAVLALGFVVSRKSKKRSAP